MRVLDVCTRKVEVAAPRESVADAAQRMAERGVGTLVVVDELQRPLGIVTDRDLVLRCIARPRDPRSTTLSKVMSGPVVWVREESSVEDALEEMARLRIRRLAVVDSKDRLIGLLSLDDALCSELAGDSPLGRALRSTLHDGPA
jgi:CBS domain-containing protein